MRGPINLVYQRCALSFALSYNTERHPPAGRNQSTRVRSNISPGPVKCESRIQIQAHRGSNPTEFESIPFFFQSEFVSSWPENFWGRNTRNLGSGLESKSFMSPSPDSCFLALNQNQIPAVSAWNYSSCWCSS